MATKPVGRRLAAAVALLLSASLALTGCGAETGRISSQEPNASGSAANYPVTVSTAWGDLTLNEKPERIVVIDNQADLLVSLGEQPVAVAQNEGSDTFEAYPWLAGHLDPELVDPDVFSVDGWNMEALAAYEPDLILSQIWGTPQDEYEKFSQIAPTYVGREPSKATNWKDSLSDIGALLGKSNEAAKLLADVDSKLAAAKPALAGLQGKSYNAASWDAGQKQLTLSGGSQFLTDIGLTPAANEPATFSKLERISQENIGELAGDVLIIYTSPVPAANRTTPQQRREAMEADPRFRDLPASKNNAVIFPTYQTGTAGFVFKAGPLSVDYWLETMVPELEKSALNRSGK